MSKAVFMITFLVAAILGISQSTLADDHARNQPPAQIRIDSSDFAITFPEETELTVQTDTVKTKVGQIVIRSYRGFRSDPRTRAAREPRMLLIVSRFPWDVSTDKEFNKLIEVEMSSYRGVRDLTGRHRKGKGWCEYIAAFRAESTTEGTKEIYVQKRFTAAGRRLYELTVYAARRNDVRTADVNALFASFRLKP